MDGAGRFVVPQHVQVALVEGEDGDRHHLLVVHHPLPVDQSLVRRELLPVLGDDDWTLDPDAHDGAAPDEV